MLTYTPTHTHTHSHRDKVIALSARPYFVVVAEIISLSLAYPTLRRCSGYFGAKQKVKRGKIIVYGGSHGYLKPRSRRCTRSILWGAANFSGAMHDLNFCCSIRKLLNCPSASEVTTV